MSVVDVTTATLDCMGRWEPDARGRLERAAMELYVEHGYESTTVAEIAERAGLTERTFFRHFADKREVLFSGSAALTDLLERTVIEAPDSAGPMESVAGALEAVGSLIQLRGQGAKMRQQVIVANAELRERELIKMASWVSVLAAALRKRGVADPVATLSAETGVAVFRVAFERWVQQPAKRHLTRTFAEMLDQLKTVTAEMR